MNLNLFIHDLPSQDQAAEFPAPGSPDKATPSAPTGVSSLTRAFPAGEAGDGLFGPEAECLVRGVILGRPPGKQQMLGPPGRAGLLCVPPAPTTGHC